MLSDELSRAVPGLLGSTFRLQRIDIRRGSTQIWVYVAGGFTLISQYADFVTSLELLLRHVQNLLRAVFTGAGLPEVTIAGGWTSAIPKRRRFELRVSQDLLTLLLAAYLIVSHALMLVVLLRIAVRTLLK